MTKKTRCPNCGAYISSKDKTCYVCGERITPASAPRSTSKNTYAPVVFEPEKDNDFVMPVDHDEAGGTPFDERKPYSDNDLADPYYNDNYDQGAKYQEDDVEPYFYDDNYYGSTGMSTKKIAAICGAVVAGVAVIAAILGFCFANGIFGGGAPAQEITLYFDKPSVNINLMDDNGIVYNWGADVNVNYKFNNKDESQSCTPDKEHDNMWTCKIPADATDLYFSQTTGDSIRTENAKVIESDTVYYITDILFNADDQLPMSSCKLSDFNHLGVNAPEETESTSVKKKAATKATEEETVEEETEEETEKVKETEKPKELLSNPYNVSLPSSWSSGTTKEKSGNCVTYYEKYNYKNYGNGMLLSIYTFKPGDNSYGDLNAKKILTASDGSKVVIVTPSDVEFDDSDEKAMEKYTNLSSQTSQVISSISTN